MEHDEDRDQEIEPRMDSPLPNKARYMTPCKSSMPTYDIQTRLEMIVGLQ